MKTGRGKQYKLTPVDLLFIKLVYLKHARIWKNAVFTFRLRRSHFERNVSMTIAYATNVWFQHEMRPTGGHGGAKPYFSAMHPLYGFKREVFVFANGLCI